MTGELINLWLWRSKSRTFSFVSFVSATFRGSRYSLSLLEVEVVIEDRMGWFLF